MDKKYVDYAVEKTLDLLKIDSPSGFTVKAVDFVAEEFKKLGYTSVITQKGGVLVDLGGYDNALLLEAHTDTLGARVKEIKSSGRLVLTPLGGMNANNG